MFKKNGTIYFFILKNYYPDYAYKKIVFIDRNRSVYFQ